MTIKDLSLRLFDAENLNRKAERRVKKAIELYHKGGIINSLRALRLHNHNLRDFNCYIHPRVTIGKNLYIAHPMGIGIGPTTVIGDNCRIYPYAVVAARIIGDKEMHASGEKRRHAKIGNNCMLGAGCMLVGRIEIGDNVIVAARAIVTKDVPPNSVVKNINEVRPIRPDELQIFATVPQSRE
ncbi:MAG: serine acetyltransferase [Clostridia bacterium]|nr:serine acetyltransferase [Clostridia bacterium]